MTGDQQPQRDDQAPSVLYLCPDSDIPTGGSLVMYHHVDHLNAAGINAHILHERTGFRCRWFENTTPVTWTALRPLRRDDVLVVPEIYGPHLSELAPGTPKVVFNQNAHLTFEGWPPPGGPGAYPRPYRSPEMLATLVVSEHSRRYLEHAFPGVRVHRVVNSIGAVPAAPEAKERLLAYMPRKNADHAAQVIGILASRGVLDDVEVTPIDGLGHDEALAVLGRARVFLSFGYPEGCPLPPLEAMASKCVVVGYHGEGGAEYLTDATAYPVPFGDILGYAATVERVLRAIDDDPAEVDARVRAGHDLARDRYSDEAQRRSVLEAWEAILAAGEIASVRAGAPYPGDVEPVHAVEAPAAGLFERLARERDTALAERDQSRRDLAEIRSSRSWRLTAPFRRVGEAIRGRRPARPE